MFSLNLPVGMFVFPALPKTDLKNWTIGRANFWKCFKYFKAFDKSWWNCSLVWMSAQRRWL